MQLAWVIRLAEVSPQFQREVPLRRFTTLRAGGSAEWFVRANSATALRSVTERAHCEESQVTLLGSGSNVLPSDSGVPGLTVLNRAQNIEIFSDGVVLADTGCALQELFLKCLQSGLRGLEFGVGIPGTLGGALVSNAGAYRSNISAYLTELEVVADGEAKTVAPEVMQFRYRDSILRRGSAPRLALIRAKLKLPYGSVREGYSEARDYQRQRISKQPPQASAGSFFKNVESRELAERLESLPVRLREAGVVPAGYLIEHAGLAGFEHSGAKFSRKHANFIVNVRNASATAIRELAEIAKALVLDKFGVVLEEEVLYLGDWGAFDSKTILP